MLRWFTIVWLLAISAFTLTAVLDVVGGGDRGHEAKDIWIGLLMLAFGGVFWVFATIIGHVVLGVCRRLYGPDPGGPMEG